MGLVNFIIDNTSNTNTFTIMYFKGKAYTFSWCKSYIFISFCLPPLEVLNGKNYRIKFFFKSLPYFRSWGLVIQRSKHEVTKLSPFVNMAVKTAFAKLSVSNTVNSNIKSSLPIMVIFIMGNTDHSKTANQSLNISFGSTIFCFYTSWQAGKRWLTF